MGLGRVLARELAVAEGGLGAGDAGEEQEVVLAGAAWEVAQVGERALQIAARALHVIAREVAVRAAAERVDDAVGVVVEPVLRKRGVVLGEGLVVPALSAQQIATAAEHERPALALVGGAEKRFRPGEAGEGFVRTAEQFKHQPLVLQRPRHLRLQAEMDQSLARAGKTGHGLALIASPLVGQAGDAHRDRLVELLGELLGDLLGRGGTVRFGSHRHSCG